MLFLMEKLALICVLEILYCIVSGTIDASRQLLFSYYCHDFHSFF